MRSVLLAGSMFLCSAAFAEERMVFGLPLGAKLAKAPAQCPSDPAKRDALCWAVKPNKDKSGGFAGLASLPDSHLPRWAAGHLPQVHVDKAGRLRAIRYESNARMWRDQDEIVQSISQRFGAPVRFKTADVASFTWEKSWARIEFACVERDCFLSLISDAEMQARDSAKPVQRPSTL